jgi:hypothetical protein
MLSAMRINAMRKYSSTLWIRSARILISNFYSLITGAKFKFMISVLRAFFLDTVHCDLRKSTNIPGAPAVYYADSVFSLITAYEMCLNRELHELFLLFASCCVYYN